MRGTVLVVGILWCSACAQGTESDIETSSPDAGAQDDAAGFVDAAPLAPDAYIAADAATVTGAGGTYSVTPVPQELCALGLVSYQLSTVTWTDDGSTLRVSGAPCDMTGTSVPSSDDDVGGGGAFTVECTLTGSCDETYRLDGQLDASGNWTGTFSQTFTPAYSGACFDCSSKSWAVAGTR